VKLKVCASGGICCNAHTLLSGLKKSCRVGRVKPLAHVNAPLAWSRVMLWVNSPVSVFSREASEVTVTASVAAPTSRAMSSFKTWVAARPRFE